MGLDRQDQSKLPQSKAKPIMSLKDAQSLESIVKHSHTLFVNCFVYVMEALLSLSILRARKCEALRPDCYYAQNITGRTFIYQRYVCMWAFMWDLRPKLLSYVRLTQVLSPWWQRMAFFRKLCSTCAYAWRCCFL